MIRDLLLLKGAEDDFETCGDEMGIAWANDWVMGQIVCNFRSEFGGCDRCLMGLDWRYIK